MLILQWNDILSKGSPFEPRMVSGSQNSTGCCRVLLRKHNPKGNGNIIIITWLWPAFNQKTDWMGQEQWITKPWSTPGKEWINIRLGFITKIRTMYKTLHWINERLVYLKGTCGEEQVCCLSNQPTVIWGMSHVTSHVTELVVGNVAGKWSHMALAIHRCSASSKTLLIYTNVYEWRWFLLMSEMLV